MAMVDALRAPERRLRPSAEATLPDGRVLELTAGDILSLRVQEGADSPLTAGNVISAAYELTLENAGDRWLPVVGRQEDCRFVGAFIRLYLEVMDGEDWVKCPLGTFIVSETRFPEQGSTLTLTGSDSIATALSAAFVDEGEYPCTLQALWERAVARSGYDWSGTVAGGGGIVDARPDWGQISLRGAMGHIAQAVGCFVHLDRAGNLVLERCGRTTHDALLGPEAYMTLDQTFATFGPVSSLQIEPRPDADGEARTLTVYSRDYDGSGDCVSVQNNPLFVQGADHLYALAENMLAQLVGIALTQAKFRWRGDPAVGVGSCVLLTDTHRLRRLVMVTRQTLIYDGGFWAESQCEVPAREDSGVLRLFTGGGLNAGALVGTLNGALLANGTVAARSIVAHSITADQLQAGVVEAQAIRAVTAKVEELAAGQITADALYAAIAEIASASIRTANIDWAGIQTLRAQMAQIADAQVGQLRAEVADIAQAAIDDAVIHRLEATVADLVEARVSGATITTAQISDLRAEIAGVIALAAQDGRFDFAKVARLVSGAMVLEEGVAGTVMIRNLVATRANIVGAVLGELVLRGDDGGYYQVSVQSDGMLRTQSVTLTDGEIAAGQTGDGRVIVSTEANIGELNAGTLKACSAILGEIFAGALSAGKISASEAFLASASVPELYTTAVRAIGDSLTFSARESIRMEVSRAVRDTVAGARNYLTGSLALTDAMQTASRAENIVLEAAGVACRTIWRLCGNGFVDGRVIRYCGAFRCAEGV